MPRHRQRPCTTDRIGYESVYPISPQSAEALDADIRACLLGLDILMPIRGRNSDELFEQGCSIAATHFFEANHGYRDSADRPRVSNAKTDASIKSTLQDIISITCTRIYRRRFRKDRTKNKSTSIGKKMRQFASRRYALLQAVLCAPCATSFISTFISGSHGPFPADFRPLTPVKTVQSVCHDSGWRGNSEPDDCSSATSHFNEKEKFRETFFNRSRNAARGRGPGAQNCGDHAAGYAE
jgi:hypothetical protein